MVITKKNNSGPRQRGKSIADVEKLSGVARATLRMWERRYGFPTPSRDAAGERVYPLDQIEKLQLVQQINGRGKTLRPGMLLGMSASELIALKRKIDAAQTIAPIDVPLLDMVKKLDGPGLQNLFSQSMMDVGLERFLIEKVTLWNKVVGQAWGNGEVQLFEGRHYLECLESSLRNCMTWLPQINAASSPNILLCTLENDPHMLGLLMVKILFSLEKCNCEFTISELSPSQIIKAAEVTSPDLVGISINKSLTTRQLIQIMRDIREKLPSQIPIWIGGSSPEIHKLKEEGITVFANIAEVRKAISEFRNGWEPRHDFTK